MSYKCVINSTTKIVENVIVLAGNATWTPPQGYEFAPKHDGNIGDLWDGTNFVAPVVIDPTLEAPGEEPDVIG